MKILQHIFLTALVALVAVPIMAVVLPLIWISYGIAWLDRKQRAARDSYRQALLFSGR